jgi:hypothetical protein
LNSEFSFERAGCSDVATGSAVDVVPPVPAGCFGGA